MFPAASRLVSEKVVKPSQGTRQQQQQLHHPKKKQSIPSKTQQGVKPSFIYREDDPIKNLRMPQLHRNPIHNPPRLHHPGPILPGRRLPLHLQDQSHAPPQHVPRPHARPLAPRQAPLPRPLREAEIERLNEQAWRELMEILFAITIFRQDFSSGFLPLVVTLLLIKALHWLAQKRVEYIETTPNVSRLAHVRIVSFMAFLLVVDSLFMYMILATTTVAIFVKYVFFVTDMIMDGQWEKKPVYTFYLELIRDLLHLSMYICFFFVIFMNYGVPLHLLRDLYETFRNFQIRVSDYLRYRKITSNMNDRFPDATPEELTESDATCIICREEMTTAKKLICGHLFHVHCLRSWLERQQTCPTCRALVVPPENGASTTAAGQRGLHQGSQQGTSSSAAHGSETRSSAGVPMIV
ncbi:hypothetical protein Bca52824_020875 [Brassica carinata]|uniref:RING-type E3 ubiquitin transferase n=1 Tax=Brassica carinata TaxID=52824 RepID=A0A8X8B106_BRACI|nr:hypothetical protein Bca52824_020875 [Brassica carinata]